jgi:hypothetical protein
MELHGRSHIIRGMAAVLMALPPIAMAALGGKAESAASPAVASRNVQRPPASATSAATSAPAYSVHERVDAAGTTLKEFADAGGKVFAVTWDGPAKPNLRQLLGDYFEEYAGTARPRGGHHRDITESNRLVVRSNAYLRSYSGLAYLPSALPEGVKLEDLQ